MATLTLLTEKEISSLEVLKDYGRLISITDLAIASGAYVNNYVTLESDSSLIGRCGTYFTSTFQDPKFIKIVEVTGRIDTSLPNFANICIRPIIKDIKDKEQIFSKCYEKCENVLEVLYQEYPQNLASKEMISMLEEFYQADLLDKTGKVYTFNGCQKNRMYFPVELVSYPEYILEDKKYIRYISQGEYFKFKLSDGKIYHNDEPIWIEVSPIPWLIDIDTEYLISTKGLLSGFRFHDESYKGDFESSEIKQFLNNYMTPQITGKVYQKKLK